MKSAVISGATGAIGVALINELISHDVKILVLVNRNSKRKEILPKHRLVSIMDCSLEDMQSTYLDISAKEYDAFYHLAWAGTTGNDRNNMYLQNQNVKYALDAVELANRMHCKVFIGTGSQAEYGRFSGKINENTSTFPENGYGIAKLCAGQMTRERAHQLGMRQIWARIFSVYGPYDGKQSMIMSSIDKMLKGEKTSFTKGEQMWDYLYSKDAAKALYLLGDKNLDGIYCLGSGSARPLKEFILEMQDIINPKLEIGLGDIPYTKQQVMHLCADIEKLHKDTGFQPIYNFKKGILETIDFVNKASAD